MERTIQIIIASTAFNCSEEAYDKLSSYLERLKAHFAHEADNEEIIRDIESRIAEKLLEQHHILITLEDVLMVINEVGDISEIDDVEDEANEPRAEKRLYRDTDNAYIAGVAGGIAAYFGTSPILIRLLFLITLFFGGTGIIVYVMLWIVIPEAKTSAQKLQMHGKAVTFETISETVKARVTESERSNVLKRTVSFIREVVSRVIQFIAKVLGLLVIGGSFIAIISLIIFLGVVLTNWNAPYNDFPLREASSTLLLGTALISGFVVATTTLIFIFTLGYALLRGRMIIPAALGLALVGIWSLAVVGMAVSGTKIVGDYYTYLQTNPEHEMVTQTHDIDPIGSVIMQDARVRLQSGDSYQLLVEGQTKDVERLTFSTTNGVLTVSTEEPEDCLFCTYSSPTVTITVPDITNIEVNDSSLTFDDYTDTELQVTTTDASIRGSLTVEELTLTTKDSRFRTDLIAEVLVINADNSSYTLAGSSETANITLRDTGFYADELVLQDATLSATDSYVEVDVRGEFTEDVDEESNVNLKRRIINTER